MDCKYTDFPVLTRLVASNRQWAEDVQAAESTFFAKSATGQSPKVLWIGCADSRVPESVVMAVRPGEVFVHRNIANQFHINDDSAISVLTYAVEQLGVQHIVVCGHTQCGGAAAAFGAARDPSQAFPPTVPLGRWLAPMVKLAGKLVKSDPSATPLTLIDESVKEQVRNVISTEVVQTAWLSGKKLYVHGWVYQLESGLLKDLGVSKGGPE